MINYVIQPFDPSSASRDDWSNFHRFRRKIRAESSPGEPSQDDAGVEGRLQRILAELEVKLYSVRLRENPSEIIAWLRMSFFRDTSPSYSGNEHLLKVWFSVVKEYRRNGIGGDFLKLIHEFAVEKGKGVVIGVVFGEGGREFSRMVGAIEALVSRVDRLNLDEVDWNMVGRWKREGAERSPDASMECYSSIPDERLEAYCRKYTEVANQTPIDDLDTGDTVFTPETWRRLEESVARAGQTWLTAMVIEKNGDISGLTDVLYTPSKVPLMDQWLTGVVEKYRGRGKGKWLKSVMLLKIREVFPDIRIISTSNARSNAPMVAINERLGYRLYRENFNVQIDTEKLGDFLAKSRWRSSNRFLHN